MTCRYNNKQINELQANRHIRSAMKHAVKNSIIAVMAAALLPGCSVKGLTLGGLFAEQSASACADQATQQSSIDQLLVAIESGASLPNCTTQEVADAGPDTRQASGKAPPKTVEKIEDTVLSTKSDVGDARNTRLATLSEAVSKALTISPEVRAATSDIDGAKTGIEIARGGYYPTLQFGAGPDTGQRGNLGYDIQLSQMLYDWGRVGSRVAAAKATSQQKIEQLLIIRSDVALDVVEVYFDIEGARSRLDAARSYKKRLGRLASLTKDRVAAGYVDSAELSRLRQDQAYADEQIAAEQGTLQAAITSYRILVESDPQKLRLPTLPPVLQLLTAPRSIEKVVLRAPHFRQAQENLAIADANVEQADANLLPELRLEGNHLRREVGGQLTTDYTIGLRLRMTIDGPSPFKRASSERQKRESAKLNIETVRRNLLRKLSTLKESETALKSRASALDKRIKQLGKTLNSYEEQFSVGLRGMNDLLYAEREIFESSRQKTNTKNEYQRIAYRAAAQVGLISHLLEGKFEDVLK